MKKYTKTEYSKYSADELLKLGLKKLSIEDNDHKLFNNLKLYTKEIILFNKSFNLVNLKDEKDLIVSHILDSLSAWKCFYQEIKEYYNKLENREKAFIIADVGSGAGFPGIPLACLFSLPNYSFPNLRFNLVERMERRCNFLRNQKLVLKLKNIKIINSELENIDSNSFNIVTCRAFRTLNNEILSAMLYTTTDNGKIFMYKATEEKIMQDLNYIQDSKLNFRLEKLNMPLLKKKRHLLLIKKNINSISESIDLDTE